MKAVVMYESMYRDTHLVADAIANGLRQDADVVVVPVDEPTRNCSRVRIWLWSEGRPTHTA